MSPCYNSENTYSNNDSVVTSKNPLGMIMVIPRHIVDIVLLLCLNYLWTPTIAHAIQRDI